MAYGDRSLSRTNFKGPVVGAYDSITFAPFGASATPGGVTSTFFIPLNYNCRVMEVSIACTSSAGGVSRPTVQITDGVNNLFSGSATVVSAGEIGVTPTSSPSLVAAQRTRVDADILRLSITTVASELVTGMVINITLWVQDHAVADEAND